MSKMERYNSAWNGTLLPLIGHTWEYPSVTIFRQGLVPEAELLLGYLNGSLVDTTDEERAKFVSFGSYLPLGRHWIRFA